MSSATDEPILDTLRELSLAQLGSTKSIADFLLLEGSGVGRLSMAEVARATYASKPTLVRFAKQLGFSGWTDFRVAFLKEASAADELAAQKKQVDVNYPFGKDATPGQAVEALLRVRKLAAEQAQERLSDDLLRCAAGRIMEASQLVLFARPPGWYFASNFSYNLNTIGKNCWMPHAEEGDLAMHVLGRGGCIVAVSYYGALDKEPLCYAERSRRHGASLVAITTEGSRLAHEADVALTFAAAERYYDKITGFYSCACMELYLEALFATCYLQNYESFAQDRSIRASWLEASNGVRDDFSER